MIRPASECRRMAARLIASDVAASSPENADSFESACSTGGESPVFDKRCPLECLTAFPLLPLSQVVWSATLNAR